MGDQGESPLFPAPSPADNGSGSGTGVIEALMRLAPNGLSVDTAARALADHGHVFHNAAAAIQRGDYGGLHGAAPRVDTFAIMMAGGAGGAQSAKLAADQKKARRNAQSAASKRKTRAPAQAAKAAAKAAELDARRQRAAQPSGNLPSWANSFGAPSSAFARPTSAAAPRAAGDAAAAAAAPTPGPSSREPDEQERTPTIWDKSRENAAVNRARAQARAPGSAPARPTPMRAPPAPAAVSIVPNRDAFGNLQLMPPAAGQKPTKRHTGGLQPGTKKAREAGAGNNTDEHRHHAAIVKAVTVRTLDHPFDICTVEEIASLSWTILGKTGGAAAKQAFKKIVERHIDSCPGLFNKRDPASICFWDTDLNGRVELDGAEPLAAEPLAARKERAGQAAAAAAPQLFDFDEAAAGQISAVLRRCQFAWCRQHDKRVTQPAVMTCVPLLGQAISCRPCFNIATSDFLAPVLERHGQELNVPADEWYDHRVTATKELKRSYEMQSAGLRHGKALSKNEWTVFSVLVERVKEQHGTKNDFIRVYDAVKDECLPILKDEYFPRRTFPQGNSLHSAFAIYESVQHSREKGMRPRGDVDQFGLQQLDKVINFVTAELSQPDARTMFEQAEAGRKLIKLMIATVLQAQKFSATNRSQPFPVNGVVREIYMLCQIHETNKNSIFDGHLSPLDGDIALFKHIPGTNLAAAIDTVKTIALELRELRIFQLDEAILNNYDGDYDNFQVPSRRDDKGLCKSIRKVETVVIHLFGKGEIAFVSESIPAPLPVNQESNTCILPRQRKDPEVTALCRRVATINANSSSLMLNYVTEILRVSPHFDFSHRQMRSHGLTMFSLLGEVRLSPGRLDRETSPASYYSAILHPGRSHAVRQDQATASLPHVWQSMFPMCPARASGWDGFQLPPMHPLAAAPIDAFLARPFPPSAQDLPQLSAYTKHADTYSQLAADDLDSQSADTDILGADDMFAIDRAEGDDDQNGSDGGGAAVAAVAAAAAAAPAAAVPTLDGHLESLRRDAGLLG